MAAWLGADDVMAVWTLYTGRSDVRTPPAGAGTRAGSEAAIAEGRLGDLVRAANVVMDVEPIKALAVRLLRLHALRAFDALQLAAAIHWAEGHPQGRTLHTLDRQLALGAQREGVVVPAVSPGA